MFLITESFEYSGVMLKCIKQLPYVPTPKVTAVIARLINYFQTKLKLITNMPKCQLFPVLPSFITQ